MKNKGGMNEVLYNIADHELKTFCDFKNRDALVINCRDTHISFI